MSIKIPSQSEIVRLLGILLVNVHHMPVVLARKLPHDEGLPALAQSFNHKRHAVRRFFPLQQFFLNFSLKNNHLLNYSALFLHFFKRIFSIHDTFSSEYFCYAALFQTNIPFPCSFSALEKLRITFHTQAAAG